MTPHTVAVRRVGAAATVTWAVIARSLFDDLGTEHVHQLFSMLTALVGIGIGIDGELQRPSSHGLLDKASGGRGRSRAPSHTRP